jgi:hypothetical protein
MVDKFTSSFKLGKSSLLSMSIAITFMRGSFDGIYSSTYQLSKQPRNIEQISEVVNR